jgi:translation initiation factor IF-3
MAGVLQTRDALALARQQGLDLVEVSPNADPPVCRIMDFGKFQYDENRKKKEGRKKQHAHVIKEVKFHANVADHDYATKLGHAREFLQKGFKVKVSLTFRGRENVHREFGYNLIDRVLKDCEDVGIVEMPPKRLGRLVLAMLGSRPARGEGSRPAAPRRPSPPPGPGATVPAGPAVAPVGAPVPGAAPTVAPAVTPSGAPTPTTPAASVTSVPPAVSAASVPPAVSATSAPPASDGAACPGAPSSSP